MSGLSQSPGTNVALGKGGQSLNVSKSRLEEEWAEHHCREQRELEIMNTQQIHCKWDLGAAYGNLRHQRTKEREMLLTKSDVYIIKTRMTSTV